MYNRYSPKKSQYNQAILGSLGHKVIRLLAGNFSQSNQNFVELIMILNATIILKLIKPMLVLIMPIKLLWEVSIKEFH